MPEHRNDAELREQEKELAEKFGVPAERVAELGELVSVIFALALQQQADQTQDLAGLAGLVRAWPGLSVDVKAKIKRLIEGGL